MVDNPSKYQIQGYITEFFCLNFQSYLDYNRSKEPYNTLQAYMVTINYMIGEKEYLVDQIEQNPHITLSRPEITTIVDVEICELEREYQEEFERLSAQTS